MFARAQYQVSRVQNRHYFGMRVGNAEVLTPRYAIADPVEGITDRPFETSKLLARAWGH